MKFLFYLGHPAHFYLFKNCITQLKDCGHAVKILIKKKDVLEDLVQSAEWNYSNILPNGRKDNKLSIAFGLLVRNFAINKVIKEFVPDLMVGTSPDIAQVGRLKGVPSLVVNEDDCDAVPLFVYLSYPFASNILAPDSCEVGRWKAKNISYNGYHELAYLHPDYFVPEKHFVNHLFNGSDRYFILRFAKLGAHHDNGKTGLNTKITENIIKKLSENGNVYITSERELEPQFEKYRIKIEPSLMHHALYFADLFIGDSQTMTAEAAVLGTPSIRFNDFVGKLGYLEELEHRYGLTRGIKTTEPEKLYSTIDEFLSNGNLKEEWQEKRLKMLGEKIDVTAFMVWVIENYPRSVGIVQKDPAFQYRFK